MSKAIFHQTRERNSKLITTVEQPAEHDSRLVWLAALVVAGIGAYIMFDAVPGVNWGIWTAAAATGLVLVIRARNTLSGSVLLMLATATILAAGAAVSADPFIAALVCLTVMLFLSLAMLLAIGPGLDRLTAVFVVFAPFVAAGNAVAESFRRFVALTRVFHSTRARAAVRGIIITVPIVVVFAVLLANVDPLFAIWREEIVRILSTWSFIPRAIFFCGLLVIVLGTYSFAALTPLRVNSQQPAAPASIDSALRIGATERLILVSSVAALFWLFIFVQLSYLFGNAPSRPGSRITFAEYAQRGFAELTIVATCSALLVIVSERYGRTNGQVGRLKAVTMVMLLAVVIILASAFYRVTLYEAAYGYTVSRLYAQVYMVVLAFALIALTIGVARTLDTGVLFRQVFAVAVMAFAVLVFWNHEAWIASANIDRSATTGKLDAVYITRDLSLNAIPVIVSRLKTLPEPMGTDVHNAIVAQYGNGRRLHPDRWFEWNLRRRQAHEALASLGLPLPTTTPVVVRPPS